MKVDITSGTLSAALISATALVVWVPIRDGSHDTRLSNGLAMEVSAVVPQGHGRVAYIASAALTPGGLDCHDRPPRFQSRRGPATALNRSSPCP